MHVIGGYRTMSPVQICNGLGAYDAGQVKYRTLRTYFACVTVLAAREAARRARGESVRRVAQIVRAAELARLAGSSERIATCDLKRLARVGLIEREGELVRIAEALLPCARELIEWASLREAGLDRFPCRELCFGSSRAAGGQHSRRFCLLTFSED